MLDHLLKLIRIINQIHKDPQAVKSRDTHENTIRRTHRETPQPFPTLEVRIAARQEPTKTHKIKASVSVDPHKDQSTRRCFSSQRWFASARFIKRQREYKCAVSIHNFTRLKCDCVNDWFYFCREVNARLRKCIFNV